MDCEAWAETLHQSASISPRRSKHLQLTEPSVAKGSHRISSTHPQLSDVNGLDVNGLDVNGLDVNGLDVNGLDVNGLDVNGLDVNGLDVNGLDVNG
jgi:hypothetical protein